MVGHLGVYSSVGIKNGLIELLMETKDTPSSVRINGPSAKPPSFPFKQNKQTITRNGEQDEEEVWISDFKTLKQKKNGSRRIQTIWRPSSIYLSFCTNLTLTVEAGRSFCLSMLILCNARELAGVFGID